MHRNPAGTHRLGVVSDRMDELEGYNASFGRDAALVLRQVAEELPKEKVAKLVDQAERQSALVIV